MSAPLQGTCCEDCGLCAPETQTKHTLIGPRHGWRLSRVRLEDGSYNVEWRCPKCWTTFKSSTPPR